MSATTPRWAHGRAFTLIELLVVMGILLLLSVLTTVAVGGIARDARLAAAQNTVVTVLGNARAIAIQDNKMVLVTFRVTWDPTKPTIDQRTEAVVAEWTGRTDFIPLNQGGPLLKDMFRPVPGQPPRQLAAGIKVAGPRTDFDQDNVWITQPEFRNKETDRAFGVLFGPDGTVISRNPQAPATLAHYAWLDANGNGNQDTGNTGSPAFFAYDELVDEPNINFVQFLVVFDDRDARERYDVATWNGVTGGPNAENVRRANLSEYISALSDRIHFNRYSGVVQR
ncbi:MAG: prepilin-type N-terminal cleavage/methylation domain-containing protein [Phycisphaerales bacterium]|jgi:type II secretory pathway pseudopilin PulG